MKKKNILIIVLCVVIVGLLSVVTILLVNKHNTEEYNKNINDLIDKAPKEKEIQCLSVKDSVDGIWKNLKGDVVNIQQINDMNDIIDEKVIIANQKNNPTTNIEIKKDTKYIIVLNTFRFKWEDTPSVESFKKEAFIWNSTKDTISLTLNFFNIMLSNYSSYDIQHIKVR